MGREDRERRKQEQADKQRQRQIKMGVAVDPKREPKAVAADPNDQRVEWSFDLFDHEKDWRADPANGHMTFCGIGEFLRSYSTRTWKEIIQDRNRDHPMERDRLCKAAQDRLEERNLEDFDTFWRFRFGGTHRLWGIKDRHVFRVIWWDPDHQVYPVEKKHT